MQQRLDLTKIDPAAYRAMFGLEKYIESSRLEPRLVHLIKMRASQINGCAFCIDMHSKDARTAGEAEQRLYALDAWRETPFYSERERAALAWTEALTLIRDGHAPDDVYDQVKQHFAEDELAHELVALTVAIVTINAWNRIAIGFRAVPGSYRPASAAPTKIA